LRVKKIKETGIIMQVYVPRLKIAGRSGKLETQVLSQKMVGMRDDVWVFFYVT